MFIAYDVAWTWLELCASWHAAQVASAEAGSQVERAASRIVLNLAEGSRRWPRSEKNCRHRTRQRR
jgi:hypothetical protein